jgi:hypothetical protein
MEDVVYFMDIWSILHPFGMFFAHMVYFVVVWYIFSLLVCYSKKNLATLDKNTSLTILTPTSKGHLLHACAFEFRHSPIICRKSVNYSFLRHKNTCVIAEQCLSIHITSLIFILEMWQGFSPGNYCVSSRATIWVCEKIAQNVAQHILCPN